MSSINIDTLFKKNEIQIRELNFSTKLKAKELSENIDVLEKQVQKYLSENVDRSFLTTRTEGNDQKHTGGLTNYSAVYDRQKFL